VIGYGAYVDLGYAGANYGVIPNWANPSSPPLLHHKGAPKSGLFREDYDPNNPDEPYNAALVYDTGSFHYERDGIDQDADGVIDRGTNGIDDLVNVDSNGNGQIEPNEQDVDINGNGQIDANEQNVRVNGIDDSTELEAPPPYPVPVKSMQIKIRMFEPDTRQIREVTIVHQFSSQ